MVPGEIGAEVRSAATTENVSIDARGLVKRFGDLVAVDGLDLAARSGTCLALLGPNGAGKTTTIEMLEGLLEPDAGEVTVLGRNWRRGSRAIRERIGVQLQETKLHDQLKVAEQLRVFRSFYRTGRTPEEVMELVGLREKRDARTDKLSGGQRQRLALGCALVNEPEILFLDEPTTGLDPQARRRVWEIVESFKGNGGTVLLTTHYMDEAERLADDVIIIDHGKIIAEGSPEEIIRSLGSESIVSFTLENGTEAGGDGDAITDALLAELEALDGVVSARRENGGVSLAATEIHRVVPMLLEHLRSAGLRLDDLSTHRATLEDVFVTLTGRHLRDG